MKKVEDRNCISIPVPAIQVIQVFQWGDEYRMTACLFDADMEHDGTPVIPMNKLDSELVFTAPTELEIEEFIFKYLPDLKRIGKPIIINANREFVEVDNDYVIWASKVGLEKLADLKVTAHVGITLTPKQLAMTW